MVDDQIEPSCRYYEVETADVVVIFHNRRKRNEEDLDWETEMGPSDMSPQHMCHSREEVFFLFRNGLLIWFRGLTSQSVEEERAYKK